MLFRPMDTNSPEAWFKSLPVVTRSILVVLFTSTCLVMTGLLDPSVLFFDWSLISRKYVFYIAMTTLYQISLVAFADCRVISGRFLVRVRDAIIFLLQLWFET